MIPNMLEIKYKNKASNDIVKITYTYDKNKKLLSLLFLTEEGERFKEDMFIKDKSQIKYVMFAYYSFLKALASTEVISIKKGE